MKTAEKTATPTGSWLCLRAGACSSLAFGALLSGAATADAEVVPVATRASVGYETRYIGTGRGNALSQGGHFVLTAAVEADNGLGMNLWQSYASTVNYRETNWTVTYTQAGELFEFGAGYRWLYFDDGDRGSDHEVLTHISAPRFSVAPTLSVLYGTTANGLIVNLSGERSFAVADGELSLGAGLGWETKYVSRANDGFNHLEFHIGWSRPLSDALAFEMKVSAVSALENLDREDSGDWVWGGFNISTNY